MKRGPDSEKQQHPWGQGGTEWETLGHLTAEMSFSDCGSRLCYDPNTCPGETSFCLQGASQVVLVVENRPANAGDMSSIPGSGRCLGGGSPVIRTGTLPPAWGPGHSDPPAHRLPSCGEARGQRPLLPGDRVHPPPHLLLFFFHLTCLSTIRPVSWPLS